MPPEGDAGAPGLSYRRSPDQDRSEPVLHPVVVVGAGPVGLALAIDLAQRGVATVLLDDDDTLSTGSRAICFSKRSLEIFGRLACAEPMVQKGVSWNVGKVFLQDELIYSFDLLAEGSKRRPAFINLQQYYVERYLVERALTLPKLDIRWANRVAAVDPHVDRTRLDVETPEGPYRIDCSYLVCADGSKSTLRKLLGLEARGHSFRDRFLIADVKMTVPFPAERWFWFDPPFHRNQSALLHRQPDDVWRIDFQLGWEADPVEERKPERVISRVRAMLGPEVDFSLEWVSVYTFSCMRMERFRHGRVFFAGDAAHGVSPFGARGANGGIQDADNLGWKLAWVLQQRAPEALLDSYDDERIPATDENILNSTRSTDFITPKSGVSRTFRDAVLQLAKRHTFARSLVNSGRLSVPATLTASPLNTPDAEAFLGSLVPGAPGIDVALARGTSTVWLFDLLGRGFVLLYAVSAAARDGAEDAAAELAELARHAPELERIDVEIALDIGEKDVADSTTGARSSAMTTSPVLSDKDGLLRRLYDLQPGSFYLLRPDQHVCARGRLLRARRILDALDRACARVRDPSR